MCKKILTMVLALAFVGGIALLASGCSPDTHGGAILLPPVEETDPGAGTDTDIDDGDGDCPDCICDCGDDCCDDVTVTCECQATATAECDCCDCCDDEPEPYCGDGELNQTLEECEVGIPCDEGFECIENECLCEEVPCIPLCHGYATTGETEELCLDIDTICEEHAKDKMDYFGPCDNPDGAICFDVIVDGVSNPVGPISEAAILEFCSLYYETEYDETIEVVVVECDL
jgi:hypothetical protein